MAGSSVLSRLELIDEVSARAFIAASETLNFTKAAKIAAMTQPGISQHVARLEEQLGSALFSRTWRKVTLTPAGEALVRYLRRSSEQLEALKEQLVEEQSSLQGEVCYAMPASCLLSSHFPNLLGERERNFSRVNLEVKVLGNDETLEALLEGEIDFGFMATRVPNAAIEYEPYCFEEYSLVGGRNALARCPELTELKRLPMIRYPGVETVCEIWARTCFPEARLNFDAFPISAKISDLYGVLNMLRGGLGYTFIASHCAQPLIDAGEAVDVRRAGTKVENQVYVAFRKGAPMQRRVQAVIDAFRRILVSA